MSNRGVSCPQMPFLSNSKRTKFNALGCTIYGHPSSGGILIKEADFVDTIYLSVSRSHISQRSANATEEDKFCALMQRSGATWWGREEEYIEVQLGMREATEEQKKVLVFGRPADGVGVWVLRFADNDQIPRDFGRVKMAMDMEERILRMKEFCAVFVEDVGKVEEIGEG